MHLWLNVRVRAPVLVCARACVCKCVLCVWTCWADCSASLQGQIVPWVQASAFWTYAGPGACVLKTPPAVHSSTDSRLSLAACLVQQKSPLALSARSLHLLCEASQPLHCRVFHNVAPRVLPHNEAAGTGWGLPVCCGPEPTEQTRHQWRWQPEGSRWLVLLQFQLP